MGRREEIKGKHLDLNRCRFYMTIAKAFGKRRLQGHRHSEVGAFVIERGVFSKIGN